MPAVPWLAAVNPAVRHENQLRTIREAKNYGAVSRNCKLSTPQKPKFARFSTGEAENKWRRSDLLASKCRFSQSEKSLFEGMGYGTFRLSQQQLLVCVEEIGSLRVEQV